MENHQFWYIAERISHRTQPGPSVAWLCHYVTICWRTSSKVRFNQAEWWFYHQNGDTIAMWFDIWGVNGTALYVHGSSLIYWDAISNILLLTYWSIIMAVLMGDMRLETPSNLVFFPKCSTAPNLMIFLSNMVVFQWHAEGIDYTSIGWASNSCSGKSVSGAWQNWNTLWRKWPSRNSEFSHEKCWIFPVRKMSTFTRPGNCFSHFTYSFMTRSSPEGTCQVSKIRGIWGIWLIVYDSHTMLYHVISCYIPIGDHKSIPLIIRCDEMMKYHTACWLPPIRSSGNHGNEQFRIYRLFSQLETSI